MYVLLINQLLIRGSHDALISFHDLLEWVTELRNLSVYQLLQRTDVMNSQMEEMYREIYGVRGYAVQPHGPSRHATHEPALGCVHQLRSSSNCVVQDFLIESNLQWPPPIPKDQLMGLKVSAL